VDPLEVTIGNSILDNVKSALARPSILEIGEGSFFSIEDATYIAKRLQLHHSITNQPLNKETFEYLLVETFNRKGIHAQKVERCDYPGEDIHIADEKWSLKTETGSKTSAKTIHFTKFMECAWQKDYASKTDYVIDAVRRILEHLNNYHRILTLRYLQSDGSYSIVEVPKQLIQQVQYVEEEQLSERTKRGGLTMYLESTRNRGIRFRFDGSDDKLMLTGIPVDRCKKHLKILGGNHFPDWQGNSRRDSV
jgi:hypothetical protein